MSKEYVLSGQDSWVSSFFSLRISSHFGPDRRDRRRSNSCGHRVPQSTHPGARRRPQRAKGCCLELASSSDPRRGAVEGRAYSAGWHRRHNRESPGVGSTGPAGGSPAKPGVFHARCGSHLGSSDNLHMRQHADQDAWSRRWIHGRRQRNRECDQDGCQTRQRLHHRGEVDGSLWHGADDPRYCESREEVHDRPGPGLM